MLFHFDQNNIHSNKNKAEIQFGKEIKQIQISNTPLFDKIEDKSTTGSDPTFGAISSSLDAKCENTTRYRA